MRPPEETSIQRSPVAMESGQDDRSSPVGPSFRGPPIEDLTIIALSLYLLEVATNRLLGQEPIGLARIPVSAPVFERDVDSVMAAVVVAPVAIDQLDEASAILAERAGQSSKMGGLRSRVT
ncbi:hypothetical protein BRC77_11925 [Halobacteriales archaeon QH_8_64_26]|nr:MAG: hypothetical protein BRC77_11925 [Halobacteriales archaeon QH_8_64_26]